jgi:hypothetical protein
MEKTYTVYVCWDLERDEPIYVGKSSSHRNREREHRFLAENEAKTPFHLKLREMIAQGVAFEFKIVFATQIEDESFLEEMRLIQELGRADLGKGPLLNRTDGGEGRTGWVPSDATRQLWSSQRRGIMPWNQGKSYSHSVVSPKRGKNWSTKQREWFENRTPEEIERRRERSSASHKGQQQSAEWREQHSKRMSGTGNPMFGKVGYYAGKVGPWAGKQHPNKGRKKGPDGKLYNEQEWVSTFDTPFPGRKSNA